MSDLIIIGKGFDLVHDRETRYEHFRDYLYTKDKELVAALERFIDVPDLWQDFENNLALLDIHDIAEYAMELSATEDMYRPMNNSGGLHAAAHFSSICKQLVASAYSAPT